MKPSEEVKGNILVSFSEFNVIFFADESSAQLGPDDESQGVQDVSGDWKEIKKPRQVLEAEVERQQRRRRADEQKVKPVRRARFDQFVRFMNVNKQLILLKFCLTLAAVSRKLFELLIRRC